MDAVLNWLWQGTLVAIAVRAWLRYAEPFPARVRYRALWAALALVLLLPLMPLLPAWWPTGSSGVAGAAPMSPVTIPGDWWLSAAVPFALWMSWSSLCAVRLLRARRAVSRLRARAIDMPPAWEARLVFWNRIARSGRRARLVLSRDVPAAAVLGGRIPMVAVAPSLFGRLSDEEIDRIVVHEWAHVQRRDDIAHALQLALHVAAGWHPGVMFLGQALHLEREVACDDVVIAVTGSPKAYAACLARLASLPASSLAVVAVAAPSMVGRRIARMLSPARLATSASWTISALGGVALCVLSTAVGTFRLVGPMMPSASPTGVLQLSDASLENAPVPTFQVSTTAPVLGSPAPQPVRPVVAQAAVPAAASAPQVSLVPADADVHTDPLPMPIPASLPGAVHLPLPLSATPTADASMVPPAPGSPVTASQLPAHSVLRVDVPQWAVTPSATVDAVPAAPTTASTQGRDAPWTIAAETGVAIGRGSQDAGVAVGKGSQRVAESTAGFFTRIGKRIGGAF